MDNKKISEAILFLLEKFDKKSLKQIGLLLCAIFIYEKMNPAKNNSLTETMETHTNKINNLLRYLVENKYPYSFFKEKEEIISEPDTPITSSDDENDKQPEDENNDETTFSFSPN